MFTDDKDSASSSSPIVFDSYGDLFDEQQLIFSYFLEAKTQYAVGKVGITKDWVIENIKV